MKTTKIDSATNTVMLERAFGIGIDIFERAPSDKSKRSPAEVVKLKAAAEAKRAGKCKKRGRNRGNQ